MKLTSALRETLAAAIITAAGSNPKMKYYTGTESLTPAGTLLATLTITGALGTSSGGVINYNETVTQSSGSHVAGTPAFILITTSADVAVCTLLLGGTDGTSTPIATGVNVSIDVPATITVGNA
jgi:hypothetical protein